MTQHWVYAAQSETGPVKLGTSRNPENRARSFQQASPHRISILAIVPGHFVLEERLKGRWSAYSLWGEWFSPSPQVLSDLKAMMEFGPRHVLSEAELLLDTIDLVMTQRKIVETDVPTWRSYLRNGLPPKVERRVLRKLRAPAVAIWKWPHDHCPLPTNHAALSHLALAPFGVGPLLTQRGPYASPNPTGAP